MSQSNVEIVRKGFEALAGGGVEAMLELVHDRFEMTTPPQLAAEPDTYRGHDGVRRWFESFYEAMEEVRIEPEAIEPQGEQVIVSFKMSARGRTTGIELVQRASAVCSVADARLVGMRFFASREDALAAARPQAGG